jgi:hypothetical protein
MNNSNLSIDLSNVTNLQSFSMSTYMIYSVNNNITNISIINLTYLSNIQILQTPNLITLSLVNLPALATFNITSPLVYLIIDAVPLFSNFTNQSIVNNTSLTNLTLRNMNITAFSNNNFTQLQLLEMSNCILIQPTSVALQI